MWRVLTVLGLVALLLVIPIAAYAQGGGGACIPFPDTILWDPLGDFIKVVLFGEVNCQ
jgi:hypothetical protein